MNGFGDATPLRVLPISGSGVGDSMPLRHSRSSESGIGDGTSLLLFSGASGAVKRKIASIALGIASSTHFVGIGRKLQGKHAAEMFP